MDGTLVDSTAVVERCWEHWGRQYGIPLTEILRFSHGRPTLATMEHFRPGADHSADAADMLRSEVADRSGIVAVRGAHAAVLACVGRPWAVVTSAPRELAEVRLKAAGLPIPDVMVTVEQVHRGKPDPEGFLKAAEMLGTPPEQCIAFEDTGPGVEAARRAGMHAVGLLTTVTREELGCDCVIRDFTDVRLTANGSGFLVDIYDLRNHT